MNSGPRHFQLALSVGGSKCAFALVGARPLAVLARSGRIEWTAARIETIESFLAMLVREIRTLLGQAGVPAAEVGRIGVAWPGPGTNGSFEATFIPGCQRPQPIEALLRSALMDEFGSAFEATPMRIVLDAVARAAGEVGKGGALHSLTTGGMLVNLATGCAGAIVRQGKALLTYPRIGENYGQFGRFHFFNTATQEWQWRSTPDGSVPSHTPVEVRWTRLCGGPALARRIARWCQQTDVNDQNHARAVKQAIEHYQMESTARDGVHEMALLRWATKEAEQNPDGPLADFVRQVAREIGTALRVLLQVFGTDKICTIVLAGGVGENFGRSTSPEADCFLAHIQQVLGPAQPRLCRAHLGVDAEFLGLGSDSFEAVS